MSDYRPARSILGWTTAASSVDDFDRGSRKSRTAKQESSDGQSLNLPPKLGVILCTGMRHVGSLLLSRDRDFVRSGHVTIFLLFSDSSLSFLPSLFLREVQLTHVRVYNFPIF